MKLRMNASKPVILLTIAADTANYNVRTAAGSPAFAADVTVTINAGVQVYSTSAANPAFDFGTGWPVGTTLKLINNGEVFGCGGNGASAVAFSSGANGSAGGDAIKLNGNIASIDNTAGYVRGGGGGGGSGGSGNLGTNGGGGGGGGAGRNAGGGGAGTTGGSNGSPGSLLAPGGGGGGINSGGDGGRGGYAYEPGFDGQESLDFNPGGTGGAAGYAVRRNGGVPIWLGGNNPTQVRGADA